MKKYGFYRMLTLAFLSELFIFNNAGLAQITAQYLPGENNSVEMIVHIIGQVENPGHYRVQDATNLIELLTAAGGPTEYSNLSEVTITHMVSWPKTSPVSTASVSDTSNQRIVKYDINKYLESENVTPPPVLKPGDIVMVPKNQWSKWRNLATIMRDISVVASAYFLYLRAVRD